jgi:hypothetical protein
MGLFNFFGTNKISSYHGEKNGLEKIEEGILFEYNHQLLQWTTSINSFTSNGEISIEKKPDRTIYNWGEHNILNGLRLPLYTIFWNFGEDAFFRKFKKIEFTTIGDSEEYFEIINSHLEGNLGKANKEEFKNPEISKEWIINDVKLFLYLFEMHSMRLSFSIQKGK